MPTCCQFIGLEFHNCGHPIILGYDPPNETVYTRISTSWYVFFFCLIYFYQLVSIFIMKNVVSADFKNANCLNKILHSLESANFAFSMNDWDFGSGGPNEHYERMTAVRTEITLNILINLTANLLLLTPLPFLCKYNKFIFSKYDRNS